ncbi:hypothetical protein, conserved in T. vivax, partial [Trypanosoma vivax Y486]
MWQRILVSVGVIALVAEQGRGANNFAAADMKGVCTGAKTLREAGSAASYVVEEMQRRRQRLTSILSHMWFVTGAAEASGNDTVLQRVRRAREAVKTEEDWIRKNMIMASGIAADAAAVSARLQEFVAMAGAMTGKQGGYRCIGEGSRDAKATVSQRDQVPSECEENINSTETTEQAVERMESAAALKIGGRIEGQFATKDFNVDQSSGTACPLTVKGTGQDAGLVQSGKVV